MQEIARYQRVIDNPSTGECRRERLTRQVENIKDDILGYKRVIFNDQMKIKKKKRKRYVDTLI